MADIQVTEGGRALLKHIRLSGVSVPVWCERHGFDRIQVQRVINGVRWKRISVDFALAIERATGGAVRYLAFASTTARRPDRSVKRASAAAFVAGG